MATSLLPQLQPQAHTLDSPTASTPTEAAGLLSRRWDPPPRPKPGRKPATDTPPSKRKAQNRLAQRNFRERRAAKVNELEDQMKELQAEHDAEIEELNAGTKQLKNHLALLESTLLADRKTMQAVRTELEQERNARRDLEAKLARATEELNKAGVVPLTRRTNGSTRSDRQYQSSGTVSRTIELGGDMQGIDTPKRPPSPPDELTTSKRLRLDDTSASTSMSMELDLTTRSKPRERSMSVDSVDTPATSDMPIDPCGFCDSNPDVCPCRAKASDLTEESAPEPIDLTTKITSTSRPSGCSGRPGSCQQCQNDPRSARFCKSFARTHSPPQDPSQPKPAGCGVANCCQVQQPTSHMRTGSLSEKLSSLNTGGGNAGGSTIDCAETYRRLKVHPKFDEAMAHVDDWSSQLRPPRASEVGGSARPDLARRDSLVEGRTAYEIEAASVMSTLKYFDSKFGKDARGDWRHQN